MDSPEFKILEFIWFVIKWIASTIIFPLFKNKFSNIFMSPDEKNILASLATVPGFNNYEFNNFRKEFIEYIHPKFIKCKFDGKEFPKSKAKEAKMTFKELLEYITNDETDKKMHNRVLTIYAEAGMGKSRLLHYLAYRLLVLQKRTERHKNDKMPVNCLPIVTCGIYYTTFNHKSIKDLISDIKKRKDEGSTEIKYLLLDGFDECHEYHTGSESAANILNKLFEDINDILEDMNISRIVVTSRIDMLENEDKALKELSISIKGKSTPQPVDVIKIAYFDYKQVEKRYINIDKFNQYANADELEMQTGIRDKYKLLDEIRNHLKEAKKKEKEESILRIPFFIKYINLLYKDGGNTFNHLTHEVGLHAIVKDRIKHEFGKLVTANEKVEDLNVKITKKDEEDYKTEMMSFLGKIAFKMYNKEDGRLLLPSEEYRNILCKYPTQKERLFIIGESNFHFQHKLFYEYFIVYHLINDVIFNEKPEISLVKRREFFKQSNADKEFSQRLYAYILAEKYYEEIINNIKYFWSDNKSSVIVSKSPDVIKRLLEAKSIKIVDNPIWNIDRIILLFPSTESLQYRNFKIDDYRGRDSSQATKLLYDKFKTGVLPATKLQNYGDIEGYVDGRKLILNKEALLDASGANKFGELSVLDTTVDKIDVNELKELLKKFDSVDKINIRIEKKNDLESFVNAKIAKEIGLLVKVPPEELPELVKDVINRNLEKQEIYFCDVIKKEQIVAVLDNIKILEEKVIFLEQLYFIETYYSEFKNDDTTTIQKIFNDLFQKKPETLDKFIENWLQESTKKYKEHHPYIKNLTTLYAEALYLLLFPYSFRNVTNKEELYWLRKSAELGNAKGMHDLGNYYLGFRCDTTKYKPDYDKALYWLQKAAEQGLDTAQHDLADYYLEGKGQDKPDYDKALYWLQKAAEQGYNHAQMDLAKYYCNDYGLNKSNYDKALYWLHEFIERRDRNMSFLCEIIRDESKYETYKEIAELVKQRSTYLFKWIKNTAEQSNGWRKCGLASFYHKGLGLDKPDYDKAVEYILKAAEQSIADSANSSWINGIMSKFLNKDIEEWIDQRPELFQNFKKIAEQGSACGQYYLGRFYYKGIGKNKPDYKEARYWLMKSTEQGNAKAQELLNALPTYS